MPGKVDMPDDATMFQRRVGSSIERLLGQLLEEQSNGWQRGDWIDGIVFRSFERNGNEINAYGLAIWYHGDRTFMDPLQALVTISGDDERPKPKTYRLKFGDRKSGLGKYGYDPHSKNLYLDPPTEWCFEFEGRCT